MVTQYFQGVFVCLLNAMAMILIMMLLTLMLIAFIMIDTTQLTLCTVSYLFVTCISIELDECDINVYEEVVLTNYHTRVLALVGAEMVGKRSLINRLVKENPLRFQAAIPC